MTMGRRELDGQKEFQSGHMRITNDAATIVTMFVVSLGAAAKRVQTEPRPAVIVDVPFPFVVGSQTLPAGTYMFESLQNSAPDAGHVDVLVVRSMDGRVYEAAMTYLAQGPDAQPNSKVLFSRYGDCNFLSQVWERGKLAGLHLPSSRLETELAATSPKTEITLIPPPDDDYIAAAISPTS